MWRRSLYGAVLKGAAVAAFVPTDLGASLIAWYKATDGVYKDAGTTLAADTETVQQWNDQSGNANHLTQGTAGSRPTYQATGFNSKQCVTFTAASDDWMPTANDDLDFGGASPQFSVFVVGRMLTGTESDGALISLMNSANGSDWDGTNRIRAISRDSTNNNFTATWNSANRVVTAISLATNYRLGTIFDGTNLTTYVNNVQGTQAAHAVALAQTVTLRVGTAMHLSSAAAQWDGPVSEIVITKSALSAGDRTSLDDYFKTKWGL